MDKTIIIPIIVILLIPIAYADFDWWMLTNVVNPFTGIGDIVRSTNQSGNEWEFDNITVDNILALIDEINMRNDVNLNENNINNVSNLTGDSATFNNFFGIYDWIIKLGDSKRYLDFNGTDLNYNETELNDSIDKRTRTITYNATSIETRAGTPEGDVESIQGIKDGNVYNVTEAAGANPLIIVINFTGVESFSEIVMREIYSAGSGHNIKIGIETCATGEYEEEFQPDITGMDNFAIRVETVVDPLNHLCGDKVSIRLRHVENGNPSHIFSLDFLVIQSGPTTMVSEEADPLSFHRSGDVVMQGSANWGGFNLSDVSNMSILNDLTVGKSLIVSNITSPSENNLSINVNASIILRTSDISEAYGINVGALSLIGGSKTTRYGIGGKIFIQGGQGRDAANDPSSYAPVLLQSKGGNVGIGTDSPGRLFEVFGSAPIFRFRDNGTTASATTAYIEFGGTDEGNWNRTGYIGDGSSANTDLFFVAEEGNLRLGDSSSHSVLTLSEGNATFTGNVGIGTTSPTQRLQVVGNTLLNGSGDVLDVLGGNVVIQNATDGGDVSLILRNTAGTGSDDESASIIATTTTLNKAMGKITFERESGYQSTTGKSSINFYTMDFADKLALKIDYNQDFNFQDNEVFNISTLNVTNLYVNGSPAISNANLKYRVPYWAARGSVVNGAYWAWGNGQTPQGSGVGYNSKVVKLQGECDTTGTTLTISVHKNGADTTCDLTIGGTDDTVYEVGCNVDFASTDILGIYANTETGTYTECVGTAFVEYAMNVSGLKGNKGDEGDGQGWINTSTEINTVGGIVQVNIDADLNVIETITAPIINVTELYVNGTVGNSTHRYTWAELNSTYVDDDSAYEKIIDAFKQTNFTDMYYTIVSRYTSINFTSDYFSQIDRYTTTNHSAETHAYIGNCSGEGSCDLITYDTELGIYLINGTDANFGILNGTQIKVDGKQDKSFLVKGNSGQDLFFFDTGAPTNADYDIEYHPDFTDFIAPRGFSITGSTGLNPGSKVVVDYIFVLDTVDCDGGIFGQGCSISGINIGIENQDTSDVLNKLYGLKFGATSSIGNVYGIQGNSLHKGNGSATGIDAVVWGNTADDSSEPTLFGLQTWIQAYTNGIVFAFWNQFIQNDNYGIPSDSYVIYSGTDSGASGNRTGIYIDKVDRNILDGNLWVNDNVSADNYLDHTPAYSGTPQEALAELTNINSFIDVNGSTNINHSSLPEFMRADYEDYSQGNCEKVCKFDDFINETVCSEECDIIMEIKTGRNIGSTVTMTVESIKALKEENQALKDRITQIENALNISDVTVSIESETDLYSCSYKESRECLGGLSNPIPHTRCYNYLKLGWSTCSTGWMKI